MAYPFRQPSDESDDSDEEETQPEEQKQWKPPSYAIPRTEEASSSKSAKVWKPPSYAEPREEAPKKTPYEIEKEKVTFLGSLKNAVQRTKENIGDSAVGRFVKEVPDAAEKMYEQVRATGKSAAEDVRAGNYPAAFGKITEPVLQGFTGLERMASSPSTAMSQAPKPSEAIEMGTGIPAKDIWDKIQKGNYAGAMGEAAGAGLLLKGMGSVMHGAEGFGAEPTKPVTGLEGYAKYGPRRSAEIPYKMPDTPIRRTISDADRMDLADSVEKYGPGETGEKPRYKLQKPQPKPVPELTKSPIPKADQKLLDHMDKNQSIDYSNPRVETIPVSRMLGSQDTINPDKAIEYFKGGDRPDIQVPEAGRAPDGSQPTAYKVGDKYILGTGHNRLAADMARGKNELQAIVYDTKDIPEELHPGAKPKPKEFVNPFAKPKDEAAYKDTIDKLQSDNPPIIDDKGGTSFEPEEDQRDYTGKSSPELESFLKDVQGKVIDESDKRFEDDLRQGGRPKFKLPEVNVPDEVYEKARAEIAKMPPSPIAEAFEKPAKGADISEEQPKSELPPEFSKDWKAPDYAEPREELKPAARTADEILPPEHKEAPPSQRAKMFRGAHDPVDIIFPDANSRETFGAGQDLFSKGIAKPGVMQRLRSAAQKVSEQYNIDPKEATGLIKEYNQNIRNLGSAADKQNPENVKAPSFDEFMKNKTNKPQPPIRPSSSMSSIVGEAGIRKRGSSVGTKRNPGPIDAVVDKFFQAMQDAKERMTDQEAINRATRAKRFARAGAVKATGVAGAKQSLSKLRGEFDKVEPGEGLQLSDKETDSLFTAVKKSRLSEGEKARGYVALFKLMNGDAVPTRSELSTLDNVFGNRFAERVMQNHPGMNIMNVIMKVGKVSNTMKALQNALSLAAPLRHGIGLATRAEFYPAFRDMFKFFHDKEFYDASMEQIQSRPRFKESQENGLFFARPDTIADAEEEFLINYLGNFPKASKLVAGSARAYTGFLNKVRADVYDSMAETAEKLGHKMSEGNEEDGYEATEAGQKIANYINVSSGRGDMGRFNKYTSDLNLLLWSPRMIASRFQILNPTLKLYRTMPEGMRLDSLRTLVGVAALGTIVDTLGHYAGAKISSNILGTDFGKSRFGKDVVDPWGGFQQYVVGMARFLAGKTDSGMPTNRLRIAGEWLANKESPLARLVHVMATAQQFTGTKLKPNVLWQPDPSALGSFKDQYGQRDSVQKELINSFAPILEQDLRKLITEDPKWADHIGLTAAMAGASMAGMSQSYPERGSKHFKLNQRKLGVK